MDLIESSIAELHLVVELLCMTKIISSLLISALETYLNMYMITNAQSHRGFLETERRRHTHTCASKRIIVTTASITSRAPRHHGGMSFLLIDAYGNICSCNFSPKDSDWRPAGLGLEQKTCRRACSLTNNSGF